MKVLHIVSYPAGVGMLRLIFRDCNFLYLPVDLTYAPLPTDLRSISLLQYVYKYSKLIQHVEEYIAELQDDLVDFVNHDFSQYDDIVVWHGDTVSEQLFFSFVCSLVKRPLSEVDLREMYHIGWKYPAVAISACSPGDLQKLWGSVRAISKEDRQNAIDVWRRISQSPSMLRIVDNEGIRGVPVDYFDSYLASACEGEFCSAIQVIRTALNTIGFQVSYEFLCKRLGSMAEIGKVDVRERTPKVVDCSPFEYKPRMAQGVDVSNPRCYEVRSNCPKS